MFLWFVTMAGAIAGMIWFVIGIFVSESAPQSAQVATQAVALAVLPYILARAFSEVRTDDKKRPDAD